MPPKLCATLNRCSRGVKLGGELVADVVGVVIEDAAVAAVAVVLVKTLLLGGKSCDIGTRNLLIANSELDPIV